MFTELFVLKSAQFIQRLLQIIVSIELCLTILPIAYAGSLTNESIIDTDNSESIVNERIPVKAGELESHWQVNCKLVYDQALDYLQNKTYLAEIHQQLSADLRKCGYIYNISGSQHYQVEPDYLLLHQKIENLYRQN